jgi:excisionase family DNA binding protein
MPQETTRPVENRHQPGSGCQTEAMAGDRFLDLNDVAEILNISWSQAYALVRNGDLDAIKIGGRGQWRVERDKLESYIARMYDQTRKFVAEHPFVDESETVADGRGEQAVKPR